MEKDIPALLRQLSGASQELLTKAFDKLDQDSDGFITKKEALEFFDVFNRARSLSMMGRLLKETAALMIEEFDRRAQNDEVSYDDFGEFFQRLQIPEEKLEEILNSIDIE